MKSLDLIIILIISSTISGQTMCFLSNLSSNNIRFQFQIVDKSNFSIFSILSLFTINFSILISLLDFSTNSDPNQVNFDFVDLLWSLLSKYTKIPIFLLQFVIRFDQILITLNKIPLFFRGLDPYSSIYFSILD